MKHHSPLFQSQMTLPGQSIFANQVIDVVLLDLPVFPFEVLRIGLSNRLFQPKHSGDMGRRYPTNFRDRAEVEDFLSIRCATAVPKAKQHHRSNGLRVSGQRQGFSFAESDKLHWPRGDLKRFKNIY